MAFELNSANCVPVEVELLSEIARLERELPEAPVERAPVLERARRA
jgi:hypothetical protein